VKAQNDKVETENPLFNALLRTLIFFMIFSQNAGKNGEEKQDNEDAKG